MNSSVRVLYFLKNYLFRSYIRVYFQFVYFRQTTCITQGHERQLE